MPAHDSSGPSGPKPRSTPGARNAASPFGAFVRKPLEREADAGEQPRAVAETENWPDDAVEVGAIVDAYGLKGWVKIAPHAGGAQGGEALIHAKCWWLAKGRERKAGQTIQAKVHGDSVVAHLAGLADRDDALALRGFRVFVRRADFPVLDNDDEFYWVDLVGLDVVNEAGEALGRVADLIDNGAHSVLRVEYPSVGKDGQPVNGERLIPFVGVYVKTVDRTAKRIVVDWQADY